MRVNSLSWHHIPQLGNPGDTVVMTELEWHHCFHVLRMSVGDFLMLFDGNGRCMEGVVRKSSKNEGEIELIRDHSDDSRSNRKYRLMIAFAPTKSIDRTEFAIEKLVELGVDQIIFLECDHSERSRIRMDRMEKIVLGAAKQSRKTILPELMDLTSPNTLISHTKKTYPEALVLCCHLDHRSIPLAENYLPDRDVLILIGPEGGFTPEEADQMVLRGAQIVSLGPSRLRVETAAIAACVGVHVINDFKKTT